MGTLQRVEARPLGEVLALARLAHRIPRLGIGNFNGKGQSAAQRHLPAERSDRPGRSQSERAQNGFRLRLELGLDAGTNRVCLGHRCFLSS